MSFFSLIFFNVILFVHRIATTTLTFPSSDNYPSMSVAVHRLTSNQCSSVFLVCVPFCPALPFLFLKFPTPLFIRLPPVLLVHQFIVHIYNRLPLLFVISLSASVSVSQFVSLYSFVNMSVRPYVLCPCVCLFARPSVRPPAATNSLRINK